MDELKEAQAEYEAWKGINPYLAKAAKRKMKLLMKQEKEEVKEDKPVKKKVVLKKKRVSKKK
jgi:hypothetical protein